MIEDVLLTREEWDYAYTLARSRGVRQHKQSYELKHDAAQAQKKAQCLKLLEWLNGYCSDDEHAAYYNDEVRWECPDCILELEAVLKEG
jgi:hypothetical protein